MIEKKKPAIVKAKPIVPEKEKKLNDPEIIFEGSNPANVRKPKKQK